jgi:dTDP-4-dehydrorhamnose 3,5-epimerase
MKVLRAAIPDVLICEPHILEDERGFYLESWNEREFRSAIGFESHFVQDNHCRSRRHVLRGLHYQMQHPQGKLIRVVHGCVFDVAVDLRKSSQTFARWVGTELSGDNQRQVWIPPGFAHGFAVLSETADFLYKTTTYYAPQHERCLIWNDPTVAIDWPISGPPILSTKDRLGLQLRDAEVFP